jgi:hypothetical protein
MANEIVNYDDDVQALFALAEDMGIDLDTPSISSGGGRFTPFSIPEGNRFSVTYFDSGKFEWNEPGQTAEFKETFFKKAGEELIDVTDFNIIKGYIVNFELQPRLSTFIEDKTRVTCSCIGYTSGDTIFKALPPVPMKSMYAWVGDGPSYNTPDPLVEKLGLIGSRGESCADCIRNGHSTLEVETGKGPKTESCSARGVLYIVVNELGKTSMKVGKKGEDPEEVVKTYHVSELTDDEGNPKEPFLLAINITSLGLRGAWNNEPRISGYYHHIAGLERQFKGGDPRRSPLFHLTSITLRKKTNGMKYQPDFAIEVASLKDMKEAKELWQKVNPRKEVETLDQDYVNGFTGSEGMAAAAANANSNFTF